MSRPTVAAAARNNAEWCDLVCRASTGARACSAADAWTTTRRAPQYYPDAVTLEPDADRRALLDRVDATRGLLGQGQLRRRSTSHRSDSVCSSKPQWIGRARGSGSGARPQRAGDRSGALASSTSGKQAWAGPAAATVSVPSGAPRRSERRRARRSPRRTRASRARCSNRGADVIGLSNLFADDGDLEAAWARAVAAATRPFPTSAIVGYESGDALAVARRHGFVSLGALRVWIKDGADSARGGDDEQHDAVDREQDGAEHPQAAAAEHSCRGPRAGRARRRGSASCRSRRRCRTRCSADRRAARPWRSSRGLYDAGAAFRGFDRVAKQHRNGRRARPRRAGA